MLFIQLILSRISFPHLERNTSIYELNNPGLLLVNKSHPTKPVTIFEYSHLLQEHLPVGLQEINESNLKFQIWHVYYQSMNRQFYLELEFDKNVTTDVEANLLQAGRRKGVPELKATSLDKSKYFQIVFENNCLTVDSKKSKDRDSYPLRFKKCERNDNQTFAFVSKMQALCTIGNSLCPKDEDDVFAAEAIVLKRLSEFIT